MNADQGWQRVAAYFRTQLEDSGLPPTTFAKRWGTNEKTLAKILDAGVVRGDALARIIESRGWPADAFERIRAGKDPATGAAADLDDLVRRVAAIEKHLGIGAEPVRLLRAAESGVDPGPRGPTGRKSVRPSPPSEGEGV